MRLFTILFLVFFFSTFYVYADSPVEIKEQFHLLDSISKQQIDEAVENAEKTIKQHINLAQKKNNFYQLALAYRNYSMYYIKIGDYLQASNYSLKSIELTKKYKYEILEASNYNNLAILALRQGSFKNAKDYLKKAVSLFEKEKASSDLSYSYQTLASIYFMEQDFEVSKKYFQLGFDNALKMNNDKTLASCSNGIAAIEFKKENYEAAIEGYDKALGYLKKLKGQDKEVSGVLFNMAKVYRKTGDYDLAIETLQESLILAKKVNSKEDIKKAYSELNFTYKEKGDLSNALIALEYYTVYDDSIIDQNTIDEINRLHETFQASERKEEIEQLNKEKVSLKKNASLRLFLLIVSLLLLLATLLFIYFYIKQNKYRQQIKQKELEQKAMRAQMNPHFIFNSLNSIQRFYIERNEDLANDYMADFSHLLRGILENSGKNAIPIEEEIRITKLYLDLEFMRTDKQFDYDIIVSPDLDLQKLVPPLILQPYVENAIWHGILPNSEKKGRISIQLDVLDQAHLSCIIIDNGVGYYSSLSNKKTNYSSTAKGMSITAERIGGDQLISIEEQKEGGTKISLKIKYIK